MSGGARSFTPSNITAQQWQAAAIRAVSRCSLEVETGCLVWPGATASGYGQMSVRGTLQLVHRIVWIAANGPIPDGISIDHLCEKKLCAGIEHLESVPLAVNIRRSFTREATDDLDECIRCGLSDWQYYKVKGGERLKRQCRECRSVRRKRQPTTWPTLLEGK